MTPDLHRFFQRATRPWAAIFQLLAALLAALMVAEPTSMSLTLSTVVTTALGGARIGASTPWFPRSCDGSG